MKFLVEPESFELNGCCNCSTINFGGGGKNCHCDRYIPTCGCDIAYQHTCNCLSYKPL